MNTFARRYTSDLRWGLALGLLLGGLLGSILQARPARAQFERERAAREVPAERTINLFAQWEGDSPVDGLFLKLPSGWTLQKGVALHDGTRQAPLEMRPSKPTENEYFADWTRRFAGPPRSSFACARARRRPRCAGRSNRSRTVPSSACTACRGISRDGA
ncbi:MAG: hypothetical protein BRD29_00060 [Bacteroidetes bacterium QH_2_67_10]|nr:MAG: hypothetical protein BRD29_00060 [Bacteroidetes bacterium QH_2_67_10]